MALTLDRLAYLPGMQAATASSAYLGGTMIQGLIVLNNGGYQPQRWEGTLLFYAVLLTGLLFNTYLVKYLPQIEGLILIIHIGGFLAVLIPLVYLAPHGNATDVFTRFENGGEWSSQGLSFFVGFVTGVYSFLGADSACHMGASRMLSCNLPHHFQVAFESNANICRQRRKSKMRPS